MQNNIFKSSVPYVFFTLIGILLRATITAMSPIKAELASKYSLSMMEVGFVGSLPLIIFCITSLFVPILTNRIGIDKVIFSFFILIIAGHCLKLINRWSFVLIGISVMAIGISIANVLIPAIIKILPIDKRYGMGAYTSGLNFWAGFGIYISPFIYKSRLGENGIYSFYILVAILMLAIWYFVKKENQIYLDEFTIFEKPVGVTKGKLLYLICIHSGLQSLLFYTLTMWLYPIFIEAGYSTWFSSMMVFIIQIISVFSALLCPILYVKRANIIIRCFPILYVFSVILAFFIDNASIFLVLSLAVFMGIGMGNGISLNMTLIFLKSKDAKDLINLSAISQAVGYGIASIGPTTFGYLKDISGGYSISLSILFILSFIFYLAGEKIYSIKV